MIMEHSVCQPHVLHEREIIWVTQDSLVFLKMMPFHSSLWLSIILWSLCYNYLANVLTNHWVCGWGEREELVESVTPLSAALTWAAVICELSSWTMCFLFWLLYFLWRPMLWKFALSFLVQHISLEFKVEIGHTVFVAQSFFIFLVNFQQTWREVGEYIEHELLFLFLIDKRRVYLLLIYWNPDGDLGLWQMPWPCDGLNENGPHKPVGSDSIEDVVLLE